MDEEKPLEEMNIEDTTNEKTHKLQKIEVIGIITAFIFSFIVIALIIVLFIKATTPKDGITTMVQIINIEQNGSDYKYKGIIVAYDGTVAEYNHSVEGEHTEIMGEELEFSSNIQFELGDIVEGEYFRHNFTGNYKKVILP